MKLEAGKRYRLRDGSVEKCLAVWTDEVQGYQATVTWGCFAQRYTLDGFFHLDKEESPHDIIAEYREPRKCEAWVNFYADGGICWSWSKEAADASAEDTKITRIECRKIEWEVPDTSPSGLGDNGGNRG